MKWERKREQEDLGSNILPSDVKLLNNERAGWLAWDRVEWKWMIADYILNDIYIFDDKLGFESYIHMPWH